MEGRKTWKVGDLAGATGVSVRALHYYEEIGLLVPSGRTAAGHRVYSEEDVARLQQIVSLRDMGLSLDQIREMLARPDASPLSVVQLHIEHLRAEIEQRRSLCDKLEALSERLVQSGRVSVSDFIEALRWTTMMESVVDKYYTPQQQAYLADRRAQFTEEEIRKVEEEWRDIFAEMRTAMETGTDPADESVQQLVARMSQLIEMFTGGDEGVRDSLAQMWSSEPQPRQMMGLDAELAAYMECARRAYGRSG